MIFTVELQSLKIKVSRSENLSVLPQIVSSVLRLVDSPHASTRELERIIQRDPAITAKILRVANSAYYGLEHVHSISHAIAALGLNNIRSLVVGVAYQQIISGRQSSEHFSKLGFWRHSLAVAIGARIFAKLLMPDQVEELYGAGMMHDVGILVMDRFYPEQLDQAIKQSQEQGQELHFVEQGVYGFDHTHVGGLLAESWGFSPAMAHAIRYHHDPEEDEEYAHTTRIVAAANHLAHRCGFPGAGATLRSEFPPRLLESLKMPEEQLNVIGNVMACEVAKTEEAFQIK